MKKELELVNVVGNGKLERELDLNSVAEDISDNDVYKFYTDSTALNIKFNEKSGTLRLFRSGKYNIMGCSSTEELSDTNQEFIQLLTNLGIDLDNNQKFSINNYVYKLDIDNNINLYDLKMRMGEMAQYEPEQSPFLIYDPDTVDAVITISNSGKSVINTSKGKKEALRMRKNILNMLSE